ncbi:MAG: MFS transporter [Anaerolineales bacterium]|uniref:MFS transporter n=1 Tax=Promineifilum sp. TaxID=2664178 RepID=UPI001D2B7BB0|nr:MFS transporter [Anaerolineales bacterium]MCB8935068.1 MFS transporter [Promineifilum sp.]MCO5181065.1 MFS transporter [Promineifilum sp.]
MKEYLDLLRRNPNFKFLWFGSIVSQFGDWFNVIAAAELITRLTDSGVALSYLFLARFLPLFVFSPFAGILADRFNRKHIMIVSDVLRAVTVLGFLWVRDPGDIWYFYILTAVQFSLSSLFTPARGAVVANVVRPGELVAANALDSLTWSTMLALGAFLGGIVAAFFGAEAAFVADSFSFLLSAFFIGRIVLPDRATADGAATDSASPSVQAAGRFDFLDGFRYLWREPFILGIALAKAAGSLVWGAINVLEITYANDLFPLSGSSRFGVADPGTATLGLIYVVSGLGTGIGPLLMRRRLGDSPRRLMLGVSLGFVIMTVGTTWLALVDGLGTLLLATIMRTLGTGTLWVFSAALLQTIVPDKYRGRVFAFEFAALTLTQSVSTLAGGYMLDTAGLPMQSVMAVMGGVSLLMTLLWGGFHFVYRRPLLAGLIPLRAIGRNARQIS